MCVAELMASHFDVECVLTAASVCLTALGSVPGLAEVKEGTQRFDVVRSAPASSLQEPLHPLC